MRSNPLTMVRQVMDRVTAFRDPSSETMTHG